MGHEYQHLATCAYRAYAAVTDNKNFRGEEMPAFDALPEKIQEAWRAAVEVAFMEGSGITTLTRGN